MFLLTQLYEMGRKGKRRECTAATRVRLRSAKLMDRLTFDPTKDKQKVVKKMRQDLQKKKLSSCEPSLPKSSLRFGSFNVNGLDLETAWAVEKLLEENEFDVNK